VRRILPSQGCLPAEKGGGGGGGRAKCGAAAWKDRGGSGVNERGGGRVLGRKGGIGIESEMGGERVPLCLAWLPPFSFRRDDGP